MSAPRTSAERKAQPIFSGVMLYFPDALAAVAELSKAGNDKHNPGEPLHWSRDKSADHADCIARHLIDAGADWTARDEEDGLLHAQKIAWRALAMLQIALERGRTTEAEFVDVDTSAADPSWTRWHGGVCPVPPTLVVAVRFRDGTVAQGFQAGSWAWNYCPEHHGDSDIVAYRVTS